MCEETFGFFLEQSVVSVKALKDESSAAITIVNGGRDHDNQIFQFENVYIDHLAGKGAAISQARSRLKYNNINMRVTGGGTGIRRSTYPGSDSRLDSIFYMFNAAGTGVESEGEKPVWMSFEIPTHSFLENICLAGTWEPGNTLEMEDLPKTNDEGHDLFANGVCNGYSDHSLFWLSTDSGAPFNASRIDAGGCGGDPLNYRQASQCQFQSYVTPHWRIQQGYWKVCWVPDQI